MTLTSHALGGRAGSLRTLLHMTQRAAARRHIRHLESITSYQKFVPVNHYNQCVFTWRTILPNFIPIGLKQRSLRLFEKRRPNNKKKNNNKMCSDMGSILDPKMRKNRQRETCLDVIFHFGSISSSGDNCSSRYEAPFRRSQVKCCTERMQILMAHFDPVSYSHITWYTLHLPSVGYHECSGVAALWNVCYFTAVGRS